MDNKSKIQLLMGSWLEHTKAAKDLSMVFGSNSEVVKSYIDQANKLTEEIKVLKNEENEN